MKIIDLLDEIEQNCSEIAYLSAEHLFKKIYPNLFIEIDKNELLNYIKDYSFFMRYLNDFAGVIYNQYLSSIDNIYTELCEYFDINNDNEYTYKYIIKKLNNQTPDLLLSISDEEIQLQTIKNFEKKLNLVKNSNYYLKNKDKLNNEIKELERNIKLVKKTLKLI